MLATLILGAIGTVLTAVVSFQLNARLLEPWRRRRSLRRILGGRRIRVGTVLHSVRDSSGGKPLIGTCYVESLEVGQIVVRSCTFAGGGRVVRGDASMSWTGREFEALHPMVSVDTVGHPHNIAG